MKYHVEKAKPRGNFAEPSRLLIYARGRIKQNSMFVSDIISVLNLAEGKRDSNSQFSLYVQLLLYNF